MKENPGNLDIHNRQKRLDSAKRLLDEYGEKGETEKRNWKLIIDYVSFRKKGKKFKVERQRKCMCYLRILGEELDKPFDAADKSDIDALREKILSRVSSWGNGKRRRISEWSQCDYLRVLKGFYRWLHNRNSGKPKSRWTDPEETDWIEIENPESKVLRPDEILTWEDINSMSNVAMNLRDKALVEVLYDTGFRIEELLSLLIKDVEEVNCGSALRLHLRLSKTKLRRPTIVRSVPSMLTWMDNHPGKDDKNSPLWALLNGSDESLNYAAARRILINLGKRANIDKPINPHNFRKSSASYFSHFLSPAEMKERYGWKQSSKMLDVYCFPSEQEINRKVMEHFGLEITDGGVKKKKVERRCRACKTTNPEGETRCKRCSRPLDLDGERALKIAEAMADIEELVEIKLSEKGVI
ncbi:MAG: site-specific integrase [Candidatus Altiarchaeales archaeon]|nr:site-specific integrase [Candidatus Altiarchaeales archaeon]